MLHGWAASADGPLLSFQHWRIVKMVPLIFLPWSGFSWRKLAFHQPSVWDKGPVPVSGAALELGWVVRQQFGPPNLISTQELESWACPPSRGQWRGLFKAPPPARLSLLPEKPKAGWPASVTHKCP